MEHFYYYSIIIEFSCCNHSRGPSCDVGPNFQAQKVMQQLKTYSPEHRSGPTHWATRPTCPLSHPDTLPEERQPCALAEMSIDGIYLLYKAVVKLN